MTLRTLAALALGCSFLIILNGAHQNLHAQQPPDSPPELIERYRAILAEDQGNLTLHYLLGIALLQNQQNAEALAELQTAYPAYQDSIEAHFNLAIAALRLNDLDSAEIYLDQALELGADSMPGVFPVADLYFNMALKSRSMGDANEAIRFFHKVLGLAPQRLEVYRQLGDLYAQREETDLATRSFRRYLEHFPDDRVSRDYLFALEFNRGQDFLAEEQYDNARLRFEEALKIQPDSPTARYYLGYIAYTQGDPEEAARQLQRAFETADDSLRKNLRPLLYNTALSLKQAGKSSPALKLATRLADSPRAEFNELFLAGNLQLEYGSYRTAHDYLQRATRLDETHQGARQNLLAAELGAFNEWLTSAKINLKKGDFDNAGEALQKAALLQPGSSRIAPLRKELDLAREESATAHFSAARDSLAKGQLPDALARLESGLNIDPTSAEGLELKEKIGTAMTSDLDRLLTEAEQARVSRQWDRAAELYGQILVIAPDHQPAAEGLNRLRDAQKQQVAQLFTEGKEALDAGRSDEAVDLYNQLLALSPGSELAREGLAMAQQARKNRREEYLLHGRNAMERKSFDEARQWFDKALSVDDTGKVRVELDILAQQVEQEAEALASKAARAAANARYKDAETLYAKALQLNPGHPAAITGKAALQKMLSNRIEALLNQGQDALQNEDDQAAAMAFRKILELSPGNRNALDGLQKSRDHLAQKLEKTVALGLAALEAGDLSEAETLLNQALEKDAYHKGAQQLRQRLEMVQQSGAKPGDEQQLYLQGVAFYTQGKYPDAIKAWETVLLLDPEHQKARLNIEKTRRKLRQIEEYRGG